MKRNVLLLTNCPVDRLAPGQNETGKGDDQQPTFDILSLALEDIDLAIVDLGGASAQSLSIVETLSHRHPAPPVIALVDEQDAKAIASFREHGAAACLKKPFKADELARLIEFVCASTPPTHEASSDKWGHVLGCSKVKPT